MSRSLSLVPVGLFEVLNCSAVTPHHAGCLSLIPWGLFEVHPCGLLFVLGRSLSVVPGGLFEVLYYLV